MLSYFLPSLLLIFLFVQAKHKQNGTLAAAKIIEIKDEEELTEFRVEIDILSACKHKYIVGLIETFLFDNKLWVSLKCRSTKLYTYLFSLYLQSTQCIGWRSALPSSHFGAAFTVWLTGVNHRCSKNHKWKADNLISQLHILETITEEVEIYLQNIRTSKNQAYKETETCLNPLAMINLHDMCQCQNLFQCSIC